MILPVKQKFSIIRLFTSYFFQNSENTNLTNLFLRVRALVSLEQFFQCCGHNCFVSSEHFEFVRDSNSSIRDNCHEVKPGNCLIILKNRYHCSNFIYKSFTLYPVPLSKCPISPSLLCGTYRSNPLFHPKGHDPLEMALNHPIQTGDR